MADKGHPRSQARSATLPLVRPEPRQRAAFRWLPSPRSLLLGLALLLGGVGAYLAARETSLFAIERVEVRGAPAPLAEEVGQALRPLLGRSLVSFRAQDADRLLAGIADIAAAEYDRDFPHALLVTVRAERAVAILRQGARAWLASASGRALRPLFARPFPPLPRVWLPASVDVIPGERLVGPTAAALRLLALAQRGGFPAPVRSARASESDLALILSSGTEVRLGDGSDLQLKLAVARKIVPRAPSARYVDVSVPERAVAGYSDLPPLPQTLNSKIEP